MSRRAVGIGAWVVLAIVFSSGLAFAQSKHNYKGWQKGPWKKYDEDDGIKLWINEDVPQGVDAVRADAVINMSADKLFPIIINEKRARSYSWIEEFNPLENHNNEWGYLYQRVSATGIDDRDYTVYLEIVKPEVENTGPYGWVWKQANHKGPKKRKGVVRATVVAGSYLLTPIDGGKKTLVSYRVWFDPGTWVPDFLVNGAVRDSAIETIKMLKKDAPHYKKYALKP